MEGNQPNEPSPMNEEWVFSAETMHCETKEVAFAVLILPDKVKESPDAFTTWLQEWCNETLTIPLRFSVSSAESNTVIAQGQSGEGESQ